jgi:ferrous iron transport protein B
MRRETHSWRWPAFAFAYMTALAWLVATAIFQVGSLLGFGLRA